MGGKGGGGGNQNLYDNAPAAARGTGGWVYADTNNTVRPVPVKPPVQVEPKPVDPPPITEGPPPPVEKPDLSFLSKNFGH
jgi:hypothetical protein